MFKSNWEGEKSILVTKLQDCGAALLMQQASFKRSLMNGTCLPCRGLPCSDPDVPVPQQSAPQVHHLGPKCDCAHAASSPVTSPGPEEPGGAVRVESSPAVFPHCLQWWLGGGSAVPATTNNLLGGCRPAPSRRHLPGLCVYGGCSSWLAWVGTPLVPVNSILWDIPRARQTCEGHVTQGA